MNATEARDKVAAILLQANVSFTATYAGETTRKDWKCDAWNIRLASGKAFLQTSYYTGLGLRAGNAKLPKSSVFYRVKPVTPSAADVLHSLTMDASASDESFPDWCANYGYSDDSIDAFETYRACCKIGQDLRGVLKPETIAAIRDSLQDY